MKEPEGRLFRKEVVLGAKYFHEHNFVNFDLVTVCEWAGPFLLDLYEHKKKQAVSIFRNNLLVMRFLFLSELAFQFRKFPVELFRISGHDLF